MVQNIRTLDRTLGPDGSIRSVAVQDDGKILLGGTFTKWGSRVVNGVVRLNVDGTLDEVFMSKIGTAASSSVFAITVQSDGKILVGGVFSAWNGVQRQSLVRLNSDGTVDSSFSSNLGIGPMGANLVINSIAIRNNFIYVAGTFNSWNGVNTSIAKLNMDGTRDTTLNNGATNDSIFSVRPLADNTVIAAGSYTVMGISGVQYISKRLATGSRETTFSTNIGTGANNTVRSVSLFPNDDMIVAGDFTTWNSVPRSGIVKIASNGTMVSGNLTFTNNTGTGANGTIHATYIQPDGKIIVAGDFTTWNGTTVNRIVRLNADGTRDTAFTTNVGNGINSTVYGIGLNSSNTIFVVGDFSSVSSETFNDIASIDSSGTVITSFPHAWHQVTMPYTKVGGVWKPAKAVYNKVNGSWYSSFLQGGILDTTFTTNIGTGPNGIIYKTEIQPDKKILVGGGFTSWNGTTVNCIVRLNSDGTIDTAFTTNTGTGASSDINAIAIQSDGKIVVGGAFTRFNGTTVNRIVRLNSDGTRDTAFTTNTGTGTSGEINAIAIQSDGKIVVGGAFTTFNGTTVNSIVRLNADGTRDTAFTTNTGTAFNSAIGAVSSSGSTPHAISIQADGKILAAGLFTTFNGTTVNRIARLNSNGTLDTAFTTNTGTASNGITSSVVVQADGKIIITGSTFLTWNGTTVNRIVRLNSDGTRDTAFTTNTGTGFNSSPRDILIQSDGKILAAGLFTTFNGTTAIRIIRLNSDGTIDTAFTTNTGTGVGSLTGVIVNSIILQPDRKIIIGGRFTTFNSLTANNIARIGGELAI